MFAIAYDLDTDALKTHYHNSSYNNAYGDIRKFLEPRGFTWKQGSILYGNDTVTMVSAVIAVSDMSRQFQWLKPCLTDIRILQLLNNDDLMPAIESGSQAHQLAPAKI